MIEQTLVNEVYPISPVITAGFSETASYIDSTAQVMRDHMQNSRSLGFGGKGILEKLYAVAEECRNPGWAGHDSLGISNFTLIKARQFLYALPLGTPAPEISAEPDGSITCEWYQSPARVLSLSIGPDGFIHYAFLFGSVKKYGSEPFSGNIPGDIIVLIKKITS